MSDTIAIIISIIAIGLTVMAALVLTHRPRDLSEDEIARTGDIYQAQSFHDGGM